MIIDARVSSAYVLQIDVNDNNAHFALHQQAVGNLVVM